VLKTVALSLMNTITAQPLLPLVRGITQHCKRKTNMRAHNRGHILELYSLTEVKQFSKAISDASHNGYIGPNI
jgi:hypothetical protein